MKLLAPLAIVTMLATCFVARAETYLPDVESRQTEFRGRLVDAVTGHPIDGAVIVANWDMVFPSSLPNAEERWKLLSVYETLTDSEGTFAISNLGVAGPPAGWRKAPDAYPRFMALKPGYAIRYGNQSFWHSRHDSLGPPLATPEVLERYANENGIVVVLYDYGSDPNVGSGYRPSPLQYAQSAAAYLKSNVDRVDLSHNGVDARRAIRDQIRAFVVVDRELTRLSARKILWDHGEIGRAIEQARREGIGQ